MLAKACVTAGGVLSLLMFLFHTQFYRLFKWDIDFSSLTQSNQMIFYTVHLALLLMFLIFGVLSLLYRQELSDPSGLAAGLLLAYSLFWVWRLIWQILYFPAPSVAAVYLLTATFALLAVVYAAPVVIKFLK